MLLVERNKKDQYCLVDKETGEHFNMSRLHDVEAIRKRLWDLEVELNQLRNRDQYIVDLLTRNKE